MTTLLLLLCLPKASPANNDGFRFAHGDLIPGKWHNSVTKILWKTICYPQSGGNYTKGPQHPDRNPTEVGEMKTRNSSHHSFCCNLDLIPRRIGWKFRRKKCTLLYCCPRIVCAWAEAVKTLSINHAEMGTIRASVTQMYFSAFLFCPERPHTKFLSTRVIVLRLDFFSLYFLLYSRPFALINVCF